MPRRLDLPKHFSFEDGVRSTSIAALLERLDSERWRWGEVWQRFEGGELERWLRQMGAMEVADAVANLREDGAAAEALESLLRKAVPVVTGTVEVNRKRRGLAVSPIPERGSASFRNLAKRQRALVGRFHEAGARRSAGEATELESAAAAEAEARESAGEAQARLDATLRDTRNSGANGQAALGRVGLISLFPEVGCVTVVSGADLAQAAAGAADASARLLAEVEILERDRLRNERIRLAAAAVSFSALLLLSELVAPGSGLILAPAILGSLVVLWRVRHAQSWLDRACGWGARRWAGRSSSDSLGSLLFALLVPLPLTLAARATQRMNDGYQRAGVRTILLGYTAYLLVLVLAVGGYLLGLLAITAVILAVVIWLIAVILQG